MDLKSYLGSLFEDSLIEEIEKQSQTMAVPAGAKIMQVGQKITAIPLILSGLVKVSRIDEKGAELLLYYLNPKESCAHTFSCCMQQKSSEIEAIAEDKVELLAIPTHLMSDWIQDYNSWKAFVMQTIHKRFDELLVALDQIAFEDLDHRLVHYLKKKSEVTGSRLINLSHEQIASELGSSRVVISRLLKKLEKLGKLLLYRHQIKLLNDL